MYLNTFIHRLIRHDSSALLCRKVSIARLYFQEDRDFVTVVVLVAVYANPPHLFGKYILGYRVKPEPVKKFWDVGQCHEAAQFPLTGLPDNLFDNFAAKTSSCTFRINHQAANFTELITEGLQ